MIIKAHAKINLGLQIVRKREDGYHDIETVFHRIGLHDTLAFNRIEHGIRLSTNHTDIPVDERNLCVRAASLLLEHVSYTGGIQIALEKRIPIGAGLGGGSADAACVLRHLPGYLGFSVAEEDLFDIALKLGSDIPFFLNQGSAHAQGRGELLSYFDLALPYWILVVYPNLHISTAWAYGHVAFQPTLRMHPLKELVLDHIDAPIHWVNKLRNDFEPAVFSEHELVMRTKEILYRTGADFALMSGSGSSVFGLYREETHAKEAQDFFSRTSFTHLTPPFFQA